MHSSSILTIYGVDKEVLVQVLGSPSKITQHNSLSVLPFNNATGLHLCS